MTSVTLFPLGNLLYKDEAGQMNGGLNQVSGQSYSDLHHLHLPFLTVTSLLSSGVEDTKEEVSECLRLHGLARTTAGGWSDLHNSPTVDSVSHSAEMQDVSFSPAATGTWSHGVCCRGHRGPADARFTGSSRLSSQRLHLLGGDVEEARQQRKEALEQQQQMKILEWENRMKVLAWEQDLVKEKRRATRQKEKAFRMKKAYYKARLRRMGERVPPSSSSSSDEEEKTPEATE